MASSRARIPVFGVVIRARNEATATIRAAQSQFAALGRNVGGWRGAFRSAGSDILGAGRAFVRFGGAAFRSIRSVARGVLSLKTAVAGFFLVAAARRGWTWIEQGAQRLDELAKFSRQVGVSVEDLQTWGEAATEAGVDGEVFRKALGKFSLAYGKIKIGQDVGGLKKVAPAFYEQLKAASSASDALDLYVKATEKVEGKGRKTVLASLAFGAKNAGAIVRLANAGSVELAKIRERTKAYGLVTEEAAIHAEVFGDTLSQAKTALRGVGNAILGDLLPALTPAIARMRDYFIENRNVIATRVSDWIKGIVDWVAKLDFGALAVGAGALVDALGSIAAALEQIVGLVKEVIGFFGELWRRASESLSIDMFSDAYRGRVLKQRDPLGMQKGVDFAAAYAAAGEARPDPMAVVRVVQDATARAAAARPPVNVTLSVVAPAGAAVDATVDGAARVTRHERRLRAAPAGRRTAGQ